MDDFILPLLQASQKIIQPVHPQSEGKLTRLIGLAIEAQGCNLPIGARCFVGPPSRAIPAEVVGFHGRSLYLMAEEGLSGLRLGDPVRPMHHDMQIPVGQHMLGRVINALGQPIDGGQKIESQDWISLKPEPINPMLRRPVTEPMDVGVRAINSLLTVGAGQRIGLFAGSGVGKSVLLGMMTKYTQAQIVVVGLIGERGREVREFIDEILGPEGLARAVVVVAPADQSPLMRLRAAQLTARIAEYFRDQNKQVLLLMDSLTRYAQAQREIALAIGEPPATKGYPPSVFARIPEIVERAGNGQGQGGITGFYTVLTEGDDQQDPVADSARAILDGHFVLSRELAEQGHYPAIDIEASISRVMPKLIDQNQLKLALRFKQYVSLYEKNKDLLTIGAYQPGQNPELDLAISINGLLMSFLQQDFDQSVDFPQSLAQLNQIFESQATPGQT